MKSLCGKVILKPVERKKETESGIILPDSAKDNHAIGEVVVISGGKNIGGVVVPHEVQLGDKVVYEPFRGVSIDNGYVVIDEAHILAVVE
jgi:chaperonin GroES